MKFRIWCDHPESDFYGFISDKLYDTEEEAEKARADFYRDSDGCADFSVKKVNDKGEEIG